jgi:Restriction endonuclease/EVE domain
MDWIFQFNPKHFDLAAAIARGETSNWWAVNQNRGDASPGDRVYFWQTGANAQLVAVGQLVSPVYERQSDFGRSAVDVIFQFKVNPPLTRDEARSNPVLAQCAPIKGWQGTNLLLRDPKVSSELESILSARLVPISASSPEHPAEFTAEMAAAKDVDEAVKRLNDRTRYEMRCHLSDMDPSAFENLIAALLHKLGYRDVRVTGRSGDGGIDVRATYAVPGAAHVQTCVQAKRQPRVGRPTVQNLRGSITSHETGLLVTSGYFTAEAEEEAQDPHKAPIALINGDQLADLLMQNQIGAELINVRLWKPKLQELSVEYLSGFLEAGDQG